VVAAHAIHKEGIYILNHYFTVERWLSNRSFKSAEELNCKYALKFAMSLNNRIERGSLNTPYKIPMPL